MKTLKNTFLCLAIIISSFLLFSCTKKINLESFSFTRPNIELFLGNIVYLEFEKFPEDANYYKIKFTSSDKTIAEVNGEGRVTTKKYGEVTITATDTINGAQAKCQIKVTDGKVFKIEVDSEDVEKEYFKGQTFSKQNLTVNAYYQSGKVYTLDESEYTVNCPDVLTEDTTITVTYKTFTTSFDIIVKEDYQQSIELTKNPTKTSYYIGETFDPSGMEIYIVYASGKKEILTDYSFDTSPLSYNINSVLIEYDDFQINCNITVDAKIKVNSLANLQQAINNAQDGDSIMLLEGIYNTSTTINIPSSKNITILGQSKNTTINAFNTPIFTIIDDEKTGDITIAQFTLTLAEGEIDNLISNSNNIEINLKDIN